MASNYINNLSNTYRQSPSLQNQFATEQDYLDLFDNNQITPAMAKAYVSVDDTSGIKSITNTAAPIIYQDQGGEDDTGPVGTSIGKDYGYTGPGSTGSTTGFDIDAIAEGTIDNADMLGTTTTDLIDVATFLASPFGFFGKKAINVAKQKLANKRRRDKAEKERQDKIDKEKKAAADAVAAGKAYDYSGRSNIHGTHTSTMTNAQAQANQDAGRGQGTNTSTGGYSTSSHGQAMHGARGGFVPTGLSKRSYFNGGIVSLRRR